MSQLTEVNRKRDKFLSKYVRTFKSAYKEYDDYLFKKIGDPLSYDQALLILQIININNDYFLPQLRKLYKDVVVWFGLDTYRQFIKSEPTIDTFERYAIDYLDIYGGLKITSIQDSRKLLVGDLLAEYRRQNLTIFEAFTELRKALKLATAYQAERIARTEILAASNWGQYKGAQATNLPMQKAWIPRIDNRTRVTHANMLNHPNIGLNDSFIVNGAIMLHPGDWNGGAENCANCRCVVKYYVM